MNNNKFLYITIVVLSVFWLAPNAAEAKIFKCISQQGAVYYKDKPCFDKDKETVIKAVKDPKKGYIPKYLHNNKATVESKVGIVARKPSAKERKERENKKNVEILTANNKNQSKGTDSKTSKSTPKSRSSSSNEKKPNTSYSKGSNRGVSNKIYPKGNGKKSRPPGIID